MIIFQEGYYELVWLAAMNIRLVFFSQCWQLTKADTGGVESFAVSGEWKAEKWLCYHSLQPHTCLNLLDLFPSSSQWCIWTREHYPLRVSCQTYGKLRKGTQFQAGFAEICKYLPGIEHKLMLINRDFCLRLFLNKNLSFRYWDVVRIPVLTRGLRDVSKKRD